MHRHSNYSRSSTRPPRMRRVNDLSPILRLPTELILAIVSFLPERHESYNYVVDVSALIAFSSISRAIRNVILPSAYEQVPIHSARQLHAFQSVSPHLLGSMRELSIFMDADFLTTWGSDSSIYPNQRHTLYHTLAYLLFCAPSLRALRIRVAYASGHQTAWTQFSLSNVHGIPLSRALETCLSRYPQFRLLDLKRIELDGFEDVESLLRRAPNLETLCLQLSAGFPQSANVQLIHALQHARKVRELVYSANNLQLADMNSWEDGARGLDEEGGTADMLTALGQTLPGLQVLDLQTRWYNREIYFCSSSKPIYAKALVQAISCLPNLRILALPASVHNVKDLAILRTSLPRTPAELRAAVPIRVEALSRVTAREQQAVEQLRNTQMQSISFVRHAIPDDRVEYCVKYSINVAPERRPGRPGASAIIIRPARVDIVDVKLLEASDGQYSAAPALAGPLSRSFSAFLPYRGVRDGAGPSGGGEHALVTSMIVGGAGYAYS